MWGLREGGKRMARRESAGSGSVKQTQPHCPCVTPCTPPRPATGGALSRPSGGPLGSRSDALVRVPPPSLGADLADLLTSGQGADCEFLVEDEVGGWWRLVAVGREVGHRRSAGWVGVCSAKGNGL